MRFSTYADVTRDAACNPACCARAQSSFRGGHPRCRDQPRDLRSTRAEGSYRLPEVLAFRVLVFRLVRDGEGEVSGEDQTEVDTYFDRISRFMVRRLRIRLRRAYWLLRVIRAAFDDRKITRRSVVAEGRTVPSRRGSRLRSCEFTQSPPTRFPRSVVRGSAARWVPAATATAVRPVAGDSRPGGPLDDHWAGEHRIGDAARPCAGSAYPAGGRAECRGCQGARRHRRFPRRLLRR